MATACLQQVSGSDWAQVLYKRCVLGLRRQSGGLLWR